MTLLSTRHLNISIAGKSVCLDLNIALQQGERWAILGANGSGKTTLLLTLAGLRDADAGEIRLQNRPLAAWSQRDRAQQLGVLLQHDEDPFPATALETALLGRHPHLPRWQWEDDNDRQRAHDALRQMDLTDFASRSINTLSGGERRRLALATLLTQDPALMLLDEPTNHLDLHHQAQALRLLRQLATRQGRALVMILHDITAAAYFCSHALLLFGEGQTLSGTIDEVMTEANMERLYRHPVRCVTGPEGRIWVPMLGNHPHDTAKR